MRVMESLFGWRAPKRDTKEQLFRPLTWRRSTYNSVLAMLGCIIVTDSIIQAFGLMLIVESLLVTIEGCWPEGADAS